MARKLTDQVLGILGLQRSLNMRSPLTMSDLATASCTSIHNQVYEELRSTSEHYAGCPKFIASFWTNSTYLDTDVLVLLLNSGGTEVAMSPIAKGTDWLNIKHLEAPLALYPDPDGYVDSSEVVRCCNTYLSTLSDYAFSEVQLPLIKLRLKNEAPIALLLAIPVDNKQQERIYYLIADGKGNWQRVSPSELEA
jgi:hypothetical protein